jgi:hypothetical protein
MLFLPCFNSWQLNEGVHLALCLQRAMDLPRNT